MELGKKTQDALDRFHREYPAFAELMATYKAILDEEIKTADALRAAGKVLAATENPSPEQLRVFREAYTRRQRAHGAYDSHPYWKAREKISEAYKAIWPAFVRDHIDPAYLDENLYLKIHD